MSSPSPVNPPYFERPDLTVEVRTLITGGFILESTHRNPGYAILSMVRPDEFGQVHRYCFVIARIVLDQRPGHVHPEAARA